MYYVSSELLNFIFQVFLIILIADTIFEYIISEKFEQGKVEIITIVFFIILCLGMFLFTKTTYYKNIRNNNMSSVSTYNVRSSLSTTYRLKGSGH